MVSQSAIITIGFPFLLDNLFECIFNQKSTESTNNQFIHSLNVSRERCEKRRKVHFKTILCFYNFFCYYLNSFFHQRVTRLGFICNCGEPIVERQATKNQDIGTNSFNFIYHALETVFFSSICSQSFSFSFPFINTIECSRL